MTGATTAALAATGRATAAAVDLPLTRSSSATCLPGRPWPAWPRSWPTGWIRRSSPRPAGTRWPGVVAARRTSAVGPDRVPGRWLHVHRSWRADRRCVLAVLHQAGRPGTDRAADSVVVGTTAVAGPPGRMRRPGLSADVVGSAVHVVRPAFPPVPASAGEVAGGVPHRSGGSAVDGAGTMPGRGLHPQIGIRTRLLPDPLCAMAHRGHHRPRHRPPALAAHRVRGLRGRPGESARAVTVGGDRGAVRCPATGPGRGEGSRCDPSGGVRHAAPAAGPDHRRLPDRGCVDQGHPGVADRGCP